jgi:hypothetical protein
MDRFHMIEYSAYKNIESSIFFDESPLLIVVSCMLREHVATKYYDGEEDDGHSYYRHCMWRKMMKISTGEKWKPYMEFRKTHKEYFMKMNIQFFCSYVPSRTIGRDLQHLLIPSKDLKGWRMEKPYETRSHHVSDVFHITFPCTKASRNTIRNQCKHLFPESFPWLNAYCPHGSRPKDDLCLSPCHADILLVVYGLNAWDESLNPLMWGGVVDNLDF